MFHRTCGFCRVGEVRADPKKTKEKCGFSGCENKHTLWHDESSEMDGSGIDGTDIKISILWLKEFIPASVVTP